MVSDFGLHGLSVCLLYIYMAVNKVTTSREALGFTAESSPPWNCS